MKPFSLGAEQNEHFGWRGADVAEPVRRAGVEFGHLAGAQAEVVVAEQEPNVARQHVQPFVAPVYLLLWLGRRPGSGRDDQLEGLCAAGPARQGQPGHAMADHGPRVNPWVAGGRCAYQLVQRDLVRSGQQQQVQGWSPLAGLKAREVFDRLLEVALLIQQDLARSFEGTPLTPSRTHLLWELQRLGPATQQALAVALAVSPRNATGLVDALEAAGYVERRPHPRDRRATLVTLTGLGTETMTEMVRDREQAAAELVSGLDPDQLAEFSRNLGTITERLQTMVEAAQSKRGTV